MGWLERVSGYGGYSTEIASEYVSSVAKITSANFNGYGTELTPIQKLLDNKAEFLVCVR